MDGPGNEFFPRAALAGNQHTGVARRHQGDALVDGLHGRAASDHLLLPQLGDGNVLCRSGGAIALSRPHCMRRDLQGLVQVERLGQVIECPPFHRPDGGIQVPKRRGHDHPRPGRLFTKLGQGRKPVHPRQTHIQKDRVGLEAFGLGNALLGRRSHRRLVARFLQGTLQDPANGLLVVDDQNALAAHAHHFKVWPGNLKR